MKRKPRPDVKRIWLYVLSVLVLINIFLTTAMFISLERITYTLSFISPLTLEISQSAVVPPSLSITGRASLLASPIGISLIASIILFIIILVAWYKGF